MKPHGLRKSLWIANFVLAGVVVAMGAWFLSEVRPAAARAADRPMDVRAPDVEQFRKEHERERISGLQWRPTAPVGEADFRKYVQRDDYARMVPTHWVFSGPLPSGRYRADTPTPDTPDGPAGLESLGKVIAIYYAQPEETLILFDFHESERNRTFGIGEFIRPGAQAPKQFKLTKVVHLEARCYDLYYSVHGEDAATPLREDILHVGKPDREMRSSFLGPVDDDDEPASAPEAPKRARSEFTATVTRHATRKNTYEVRLDERTYDRLRGKAASRIAGSIKTETAVDTETGRAYGLRIAGIAPDSPVSAFQIKKGDVLISLNGRSVLSRSDALNILETLGDDPIVTVVLERHGKLVTYLVDSRDPRERRKAAGLETLK